MLKNYLKIAWLHLQKSKLYALVNIIGLAIGICSCLLIGIYIWYELSLISLIKILIELFVLAGNTIWVMHYRKRIPPVYRILK